MPGIAANADKRLNSYPCSDAHERASRDVGLLLLFSIYFIMLFYEKEKHHWCTYLVSKQYKNTV